MDSQFGKEVFLMKKIFLSSVFIGLIVFLVACSSGNGDQASAAYEEKAEEVIELLNEHEYETLYDLFNPEMKEGLTVEEMKELEPIIDGSGNYEGIEKASMKEQQGDLMTVVVMANYSEEAR